MFMHMRTTINIDDQLSKRAVQLTGNQEKSQLVRLDLKPSFQAKPPSDLLNRAVANPV